MPEQSVFSSSAYKRSRIAYLIECAFEYFVSLLLADAFLTKLLHSLGFADASSHAYPYAASAACAGRREAHLPAHDRLF